MPWTPSQHRLFQAAAHNPQIAREHGIAQSDARRMASEGVKHDEKKRHLVAALRKRK